MIGPSYATVVGQCNAYSNLHSHFEKFPGKERKQHFSRIFMKFDGSPSLQKIRRHSVYCLVDEVLQHEKIMSDEKKIFSLRRGQKYPCRTSSTKPYTECRLRNLTCSPGGWGEGVLPVAPSSGMLLRPSFIILHILHIWSATWYIIPTLLNALKFCTLPLKNRLFPKLQILSHVQPVQSCLKAVYQVLAHTG